MPTGLIPPLLAGLVDDAALVSGGGTVPLDTAALLDAASVHRDHTTAWYAALVGPLLIPASALGQARASGVRPEIAVIADTGLDAFVAARPLIDRHFTLRQVEVAVAKRGEDPQPGLHRLIRALASGAAPRGYAEVPLSWGLLGALDTVSAARAAGAPVAVKFRTGGLAAELFPTPVELAAIICACRERELPFKVTAGPHHAVRSADPETGFVHHGFLNMLVGSLLAADGGEVADVAEVLATTDPMRLIEAVRVRREEPRPLWEGFGASAVIDPLTDLIRFGLVNGGFD
ncbi:hypothetical protein ACIA8K_11785 [Catenuloplanes sp. NPDC051500]|uniref:hypothetical protein n=1 Tax=Catenuloplanes sp. NPDC051500 TaxID=3363959 RepID=UPI0037B59B64